MGAHAVASPSTPSLEERLPLLFYGAVDDDAAAGTAGVSAATLASASWLCRERGDNNDSASEDPPRHVGAAQCSGRPCGRGGGGAEGSPRQPFTASLSRTLGHVSRHVRWCGWEVARGGCAVVGRPSTLRPR